MSKKNRIRTLFSGSPPKKKLTKEEKCRATLASLEDKLKKGVGVLPDKDITDLKNKISNLEHTLGLSYS